MAEADTYLGDGVYVGTVPGMVLIAVNHHQNVQVYLEPEVFLRLVEYGVRHFGPSDFKLEVSNVLGRIPDV